MSPRPEGARKAPPELRLLEHWERFTAWFLEHTSRWPRSVRFTLTQRLENHALDVLETLVNLRYDPSARGAGLPRLNLVLERMRFLLRLARQRTHCGPRGFAHAMKQIDTAGRMIGAWHRSEAKRPRTG